jgi:ribose transport system permease protein
MKPLLSRIASACGMLLPLLLLCAFFSVATLNDQFPTGEVAARQIAAEIERSLPRPARVVIAARNQPDDLEFANRLEADLGAAEDRVLAVIRGEPKDAALALRKIAAAGTRVDAVACTQETGEWLVFAELKSDFPALGDPRILRPQSYRWPDFLKPTNLLNIADQIAIIAIIAIGMTLVILTGGIDLSVGSLIALSSVLAAMFIRDFAGARGADPMSVTIACIGAVLLCGLVGTFTGSMIALFDVQPFIVTLSMLLVGSGLAGMLSKSQSISEVPMSFSWLGRGADVVGVPNAVVLMVVLYLAAHVLLSRMRLGRYIYAVGGNREAARLAGVPVGRILMFVYIVSALLSGIGGVIMASQLRSGSSTYGQWYELYAITAVVVGGTSLSGGEGTIGGTLVGAFTIAVIANGMNLFNVNSKVQLIVLGLVILGATLLDRLRHRPSGR